MEKLLHILGSIGLLLVNGLILIVAAGVLFMVPDIPGCKRFDRYCDYPDKDALLSGEADEVVLIGDGIIGGKKYTAVAMERCGFFASGLAVLIYDEGGKLVDKSRDQGDDPRFRIEWMRHISLYSPEDYRLLAEGKLPKGERFVMATEQAEGRIVVVDKVGIIWEWNPTNDVGIATNHYSSFTNPDECKGRDDGRTILMTASGGAFAAIDVDTKRAKCYGDVGGNPHSVELLPDGRYVVASSNGNRLTLVDVSEHPLEPAKQSKKEFVFEDAHGVHWDADRKVLWAIGAKEIAKFEYDGPAMELRRLKGFPLSDVGLEWGHDLIEDTRCRKCGIVGAGLLAFTAHGGCGWFDPEKETYVNCSTNGPGIKSLSFDDHDRMKTVPKERWWTDEITVEDSCSPDGYIVPGARFYKARFLIRR